MVQGAGETVPALRIRCGDVLCTVTPGDAPVLIGRDLLAQIRADDPRVSPVHAQIAVDGDHWVIGDAGGTTGVFVDGERVESVGVRDTVTVRLGHAEGLVVTLAVDHATDPEEIEAGVARAGAAVEDRREELGFTRRRLSAEGVIDPQTLADFEAGRVWPPDDARARLEVHLGWEPGTIAAVRAGSPAPEDESTEILSDTVQMAVMVDAASIGLGNVKARIDRAPAPHDAAYDEYVETVLFDLRGLEKMVRNAGKTTRRPDGAVVLRDIRRTYNGVMTRAAQAPGAPLSRRLYAARRSAELTVEEAADAAGVSVEAVTDAEDGQFVADADAAALEALVRRLAAG